MRPMTVPSRTAAASLLLSLDPPPWHLAHSRAVAEVAGWLAARAAATMPGRLDARLVEAAALLHDVDKLLPAGDPARRLAHGEGSAAWLERHGAPELADAVRAHPLTRLAGRDAPAWLSSLEPAPILVAYADKRAGQRLVSMAARFADWDRRFPDGWPAHERERIQALADELELRACSLAGVHPEEVRRLPWTARALGAARGGAAGSGAAA
jgi:hypothetical protein